MTKEKEGRKKWGRVGKKCADQRSRGPPGNQEGCALGSLAKQCGLHSKGDAESPEGDKQE